MKKCLIVDDSRVVRKVPRRIMEDLNFICDEAEDGAIAEQKCMTSMPDLILLDWNMPNVTGIEFLLTLRAMPGGETPKVVFCTTENDMDHIVQAMQGGANEYIMKPFDNEIIESKLQQIGLIG